MKTLHEIHDDVERCCERLESLVTEVTEAGRDAAITEATFKSEFAKARLEARARNEGRKITVDECEDIATLKAKDSRLGFLLASNNLTVLREALRACQSEMDGLRTLAASFRTAGG